MSYIDRAEFEELKEEIIKLRAIVRRFLKEPPAEGEGQGVLKCESLVCNQLLLKGKDSQTRGSIGVDDEGPYIALWGGDQKARLILRASEDAARIHICGNDLKPTLELWTDAAGHGNIAVHSIGGVPRVGIRGIDNGGVVTVVGPSGAPRAVMHSSNDKGEIALFDDAHLLARMSTTAHGGSIGVLDGEGRRACVMLAAEKGNSVLVYSPDGEEGVALMSSGHGSMLSVGGDGIGEGAESAVSLIAMPGHGGGIRVNNSNGSTAVEVDATESGGSVSVHSCEGKALMQMGVTEGGGSLSAGHENGVGFAHLMAHKHGGTLSITGEDRNAVMQVGERTSSLMIMKESHVQAILGTSGNSDYATFMLTNLDNSSAVHLMASESGGNLFISGSDGTTQAGLGATDEGGRLALFSELGIERATIASRADGGGFKLKWGGTDGLFAMATEAGGCIFINDRDGKTIDTLPAADL